MLYRTLFLYNTLDYPHCIYHSSERFKIVLVIPALKTKLKLPDNFENEIFFRSIYKEYYIL